MSRMTFPVAVHLFLRKDDEILLLKRFNTGYEDGNYSVIAGHIDGEEDVYTAVIREAKEEAGITIHTENLKVVQVMHRKKSSRECIDYFFECSIWEGFIQNMEPNKCDELRWTTMNSLPENTVDYINQAIENYKNNISFSIYGW